MRVLLVNNFVRHGSGVDRMVRLEQAFLSAHGHDVHLVARDNASFDSARPLAAAALRASCLYSPGARRDVAARLSGGPFDVVHVYNTVPLVTGAVYDALRHTQALVVSHLHDYRAFCPAAYAFRNDADCDLCTRSLFFGCTVYRCYRDSLLESAGLTTARLIDAARGRRFGAAPHAYVACSRHVKDEHVARGLPAARVAVVHNGVADPDPEGVRRGRTGLIADFFDTTATAQRVRSLWDDRPARDAMRRAARTAFEERFCTDVFGRNLVTALEQLGRSRP